MKNKFLAIVVVMAMALTMIPGVALAAGDTDFTDATGDETGSGWTWTNSTKTLTLDGASITTPVKLPADSTIVVNGESSIKLSIDTYNTNESAIAVNGSLTINGNSKIIDVYGYYYGISAEGAANEPVTVTLNNVSGNISAYGYGGISAYSATADVKIVLNDCDNLKMKNDVTNDSSAVAFKFAGIRAITNGSGKSAEIGIKGCQNLNIHNSTMGMVANSHLYDGTEGSARSSKISIIDSEVKLVGNTSSYSGIFVNNNGKNNGNTSTLEITDSVVDVDAPNGSGLMTSTQGGESEAKINNSMVDISANTAGIRTIANNTSTSEIAVTDSVIVFTGLASSSNAVDKAEDGNVTPVTDFADNESTVIIPNDGTTITNNGDGTWSIPVGGVVLINGEEKTFPNGAVINADGTIDDGSSPTPPTSPDTPVDPDDDQPTATPTPKPKPTEKPASSGIKVEYNGGNSFSTSKSDVPTGVEIDGVAVPFTGDGRLFTVNSIPAGAKWVTVRWNSTSVTTNFTPYGAYAAEVEIPKTGDISLWAAVLAFFGL